MTTLMRLSVVFSLLGKQRLRLFMVRTGWGRTHSLTLSCLDVRAPIGLPRLRSQGQAMAIGLAQANLRPFCGQEGWSVAHLMWACPCFAHARPPILAALGDSLLMPPCLRDYGLPTLLASRPDLLFATAALARQSAHERPHVCHRVR